MAAFMSLRDVLATHPKHGDRLAMKGFIPSVAALEGRTGLVQDAETRG
ncbi:hypothetical protein [Phreatobacter cathodiphilus]|nr:hypothetical protein [Phreatobacter cathodiphilus]